MRRDRIDIPGMIRALEDYLAATRPTPPPEPPRQKTETESKLEKLLEELSRPKPPTAIELKPAPAVDHPIPIGPPPEAASDVQDDVPPLEEALLSEEAEPAKDNVSFPKDVVVPEAESMGDDVPEAPKAPPTPPDNHAPNSWPKRAALILMIAGIGLGLVRTKTVKVAAPRPNPAPAVPTVAPVHKSEPIPSDPQARALALVLAYRPSGGPVTTGEIFRSIAGDPIPAENLEIRAEGPDRFLIRFVPYRGALGENYSYDFTVDARASWVRPRPETVERLRADAIGRLAGRSDLQAFRQFLDLGR